MPPLLLLLLSDAAGEARGVVVDADVTALVDIDPRHVPPEHLRQKEVQCELPCRVSGLGSQRYGTVKMFIISQRTYFARDTL